MKQRRSYNGSYRGEHLNYVAFPMGEIGAGDYQVFLCAATGCGTVGVRDGQPFLEVVHGTIPVKRMEYRPAAG